MSRKNSVLSGRILCAACASYTAGIAVFAFFPSSTLVVLTALLAFTLCAVLIRLPHLLIILLAFFSFAGGACQFYTIQKSEEEFLKEYSGRYVTVTGKVTDISKTTSGAQNLTIKTDSLTALGKTENKAVLLSVYTDTDKSFTLGDNITFSRIFSPIKNKSTHGFDSERYYHTKSISQYFSVSSEYISSVPGELTISDKIKLFSRGLTEKVRHLIGGDEGEVSAALLLGDKSGFPDDLTDVFTKSGISHIVAVSGMHLSILTGFFFFIAAKTRLHYKIRNFLGIIIVLLYMMLTGFSPSVTRAGIMTICVLLSAVIGRKEDMPTSFFLSAAIILAVNPYAVLSASFLLSYASLAGILIFSKPLKTRLDQVFKFIPGFIKDTAAATASATIMTLPVLAYMFNSASLYSLITNILVVPLVNIIFVSVLITAVLSFISLPLAGFAAYFPKLLIKFILWCAKLVASLPYSTINIKSPSLLGIICFGILAVLFYILITGRKLGISGRLAFLSVVCIFATSCAISSLNCSVTFFDIGQGDCALIKTPGFNHHLIDTGPDGTSTVSALKSKGINRINVIFISHVDKDHSGGLVDVVKNFPTDKVVFPQHDITSEEVAELVKTAQESGADVEFANSFFGYRFSDASIDVLWPVSTAGGMDKNDGSLVFNLTLKDNTFLFTGDIGNSAEENIKNFSHIDVLKVAHHGSSSSTSEQFIKKVSPNYSVISVGRDNFYGHPDKDVVTRLENSGSKILRTDLLGDITFDIGLSGNMEVRYGSD